MITNVKFKSFRCFPKLNVPDFKPITFMGGHPNNYQIINGIKLFLDAKNYYVDCLQDNQLKMVDPLTGKKCSISMGLSDGKNIKFYNSPGYYHFVDLMQSKENGFNASDFNDAYAKIADRIPYLREDPFLKFIFSGSEDIYPSTDGSTFLSGMNREFLIHNILALSKPSTVLCIENIESGFHHKAAKEVLMLLFKIALLTGNQLIITTQNADWLYKATSVISLLTNEDMLSFLRLDYYDSSYSIQNYDKAGAVSAMDNRIEVL